MLEKKVCTRKTFDLFVQTSPPLKTVHLEYNIDVQKV